MRVLDAIQLGVVGVDLWKWLSLDAGEHVCGLLVALGAAASNTTFDGLICNAPMNGSSKLPRGQFDRSRQSHTQAAP